MLWPFESLHDYARTVMLHNPGSRVVIQVGLSLTLFDRIFIECMYKSMCWWFGFRPGCRAFIGVDECHLKGCDGGQLLSAVSRDADNKVFQLADKFS